MYVCMLSMYVCMYVTLSAKGGPIPYEKRSVFERQFNFLRFVRGKPIQAQKVPPLTK